MSTTGTRGAAERAGLGERLREARERRNLSLQELAELTKIPSSNLGAIESGQVHKLPGGIFARSFVRAYAREVGVDPEGAVREFVREHPEHAPPDAPAAEEGEPAESLESGSAGRLAVVLVALALVGAAGFAGYRWWQGRGLPFSPASGPAATGASDASRPPAMVQPPGPVPPAQDTDAGAAGTASGDAPATAAVPPDARVAVPPPEPTPAAAEGLPAQQPPVSTPEAPAPLPAPSGIRLEIHPTSPCWVRVSADGRVRLERLVQPGERPVVVAGEGIQLQVGDAGAFDYTINGQRGRPLGPAGRVVRVAIARDTVADFVAR